MCCILVILMITTIFVSKLMDDPLCDETCGIYSKISNDVCENQKRTNYFRHEYNNVELSRITFRVGVDGYFRQKIE